MNFSKQRNSSADSGPITEIGPKPFPPLAKSAAKLLGFGVAVLAVEGKINLPPVIERAGFAARVLGLYVGGIAVMDFATKPSDDYSPRIGDTLSGVASGVSRQIAETIIGAMPPVDYDGTPPNVPHEQFDNPGEIEAQTPRQ